tara:strand:+ start:110 stop:757 length:648 start_codon:yes stop_codon:yes gene_type:complete
MGKSYYYEFLTFHTGDNYKKAAERLVKSAKPFGIKFHILEIPDQGMWHYNVNKKAEVYYQWYKKHKKPFVIFDADCVIHKEPTLFKNKLADLAHLNCKKDVWYLSSGICAFDSNERIEKLLELWVRYSKKHRERPNYNNLKSDYSFKKAYETLTRLYTLDKKVLPPVYGKPYWMNWNVKTEDIVISCNERCTLYEDGLFYIDYRKRKDGLHVEPL